MPFDVFAFGLIHYFRLDHFWFAWYFREFPEIFGTFRKSSGKFRRNLGNSGNSREFRKIPEDSGEFRRIPEIYGKFREIPEIFWNSRKIPGIFGFLEMTCTRSNEFPGRLAGWMTSTRSDELCPNCLKQLIVWNN